MAFNKHVISHPARQRLDRIRYNSPSVISTPTLVLSNSQSRHLALQDKTSHQEIY